MIRILFFVGVALVAWWFIRRSLGLQRPPTNSAPVTPRTPAPSPPEPMVACLYCHVHIASSAAVVGTRGHYCSLEHQRMAEG